MMRILLLCVALAASAAAQSQLTEADVAVSRAVKIHYFAGGDSAAKMTVLFVPGWTFSGSVWRAQMDKLAGEVRVVAVDPRSQGASTITTEANTPEQRAKDIHEVVRALKLRNIVLVGWSQGVQDVAAYAAEFNGEDIAGYVLVDASVGAGATISVSHPQALQQQLERFALYEQHPREYLQGMMDAIIQTPGGQKQIPELLTISLKTPPDIGITMLMMDFVAVDRRPALAKFKRPTLLIAAASSPELAVQQAETKVIAGAKFEIVEHAGHAVFLDQPDRFHDLLEKFIHSVEQTH